MSTLTLPSKKGRKTGDGRASIKWAFDIKTLEELEPYLCDAAYVKKGQYKPVLRPENCVACDGCAYGAKYLRILRKGGWEPDEKRVQAANVPEGPDEKAIKKMEAKKKMEDMAKEIKRLEQERDKAKRQEAMMASKLKKTEADWKLAVEEAAKAETMHKQLEEENMDLRATVEALVKEKAILLAKVKDFDRTEAELEMLRREVGNAKAAVERKDHQMMRLKAKLYDHEHPEEV